MKVEILRGFCLSPGVDVHPGDIIDADERVARQLMAAGRARPSQDKVVEHRDPVVEHRDPKPKEKR